MKLPLPSSLRIGLYGAGPHSRAVLLPALTSLEHSLEAVCDPRPNLADDLAERFAFRATFTDLRSLLRDTSVQVLIISRDGPNFPDIMGPLLGSRLPFWLDAAIPGLECLITRLKRRSSNNSPVYMVSHPHRFAPAFVRTAELIRSGRLGELVSGSLEISSAKPSPGQMEIPLEYLLEGALDLLCFLLGPPDKVYASWDGISTLAAIIHFGQTPLVLQLRQGVWTGQASHCLQLHGQQGQELRVSNLVELSASQAEAILARSAAPVDNSLDVCAQLGWTGALAAFFAAAVRQAHGEQSRTAGDTKVPADLTGWLLTRSLSESVIHSANSHREVRFRI